MTPRSRVVAQFVAGALLLAASPASAQLFVDDFEITSVHLSTTGPQVVQGFPVPSPGHCIAGVRTVLLLPNVAGAQASTVDLNAGSPFDDLLKIQFGAGGGLCALAYVPLAPVDLTGGGVNDSLDVFLINQTLGGLVEVTLWDAGGSAAESLATGGPNRFALSDWAGTVDVAAVTRVDVRISCPTASSFDLFSIFLTPANAAAMGFDAPAGPVSGPPYPAAPLVFTVSDSSGPAELDTFTLEDVTSLSGTPVGMSLEGFDSGGGVGIPGNVGLGQLRWDGTGRWEDSHLVVPFSVADIMGVEPEPFLPALPTVTPTSTGFLLSFEVWFPDANGVTRAASRRQLMFDVPAGQGLMGINPCTMPPVVAGAAGGPAYSGFVLDFDLAETGGAVDAGIPVLEITMVGDLRPVTPTGAPVPAGAIAAGPAVTALPSVTRGGARFVLRGATAAPSAVELFDVTGRLVRRLEVGSGASAVSWDGRGSAGIPVSPGVYFLRHSGQGAGGSARVVVVR